MEERLPLSTLARLAVAVGNGLLALACVPGVAVLLYVTVGVAPGGPPAGPRVRVYAGVTAALAVAAAALFAHLMLEGAAGRWHVWRQALAVLTLAALVGWVGVAAGR